MKQILLHCSKQYLGLNVGIWPARLHKCLNKKGKLQKLNYLKTLSLFSIMFSEYFILASSVQIVSLICIVILHSLYLKLSGNKLHMAFSANFILFLKLDLCGMELSCFNHSNNVNMDRYKENIIESKVNFSLLFLNLHYLIIRCDMASHKLSLCMCREFIAHLGMQSALGSLYFRPHTFQHFCF